MNGLIEKLSLSSKTICIIYLLSILIYVSCGIYTYASQCRSQRLTVYFDRVSFADVGDLLVKPSLILQKTLAENLYGSELFYEIIQ